MSEKTVTLTIREYAALKARLAILEGIVNGLRSALAGKVKGKGKAA